MANALSKLARANQDGLTPVLFRIDRSGVTAVFPCEPHDTHGHLMACYSHTGQHSGCARGWLASTRPATPTEYQHLKAELEAYGSSPEDHYKLDVRQRITPEMDEVRRHRAFALARLS